MGFIFIIIDMKSILLMTSCIATLFFLLNYFCTRKSLCLRLSLLCSHLMLLTYHIYDKKISILFMILDILCVTLLIIGLIKFFKPKKLVEFD